MPDALARRAFNSKGVLSSSNPAQDSAKRGRRHQAIPGKILIWLAGLFGIYVTPHVYTPVDFDRVMALGVVLFIAPVVANVVVPAIRKRSRSRDALIRNLYGWSGAAMLIFSALLVLNGAMDRYPPMQFQTHVVHGSYFRSAKFGDTYNMVVSPSWRLGRNEETLRVNLPTFSTLRSGEQVRVVIHRGAFSMPWLGAVVPD